MLAWIVEHTNWSQTSSTAGTIAGMTLLLRDRSLITGKGEGATQF